LIKVIKSPWEHQFLDLIHSCKYNIRIASPYVKENVVNKIFQSKESNTKLNLITSCKLMNFYRNASDISAISNILKRGGRVYNFQSLHSKIYIFDNVKAIITSANLTYGGLLNNYEYGIEISDVNFVNGIISDFNDITKDKRTGILKLDAVEKIKNIIDSLPKEKALKLPKIKEDELDAEIFTGDVDLVKQKLNAWQEDVFNCLMDIKKQEFSLNEVYKYKNELSKLHPRNSFIEDKIRQQLQQLRDLGLIQFVKRGNYKKLWQ